FTCLKLLRDTTRDSANSALGLLTSGLCRVLIPKYLSFNSSVMEPGRGRSADPDGGRVGNPQNSLGRRPEQRARRTSPPGREEPRIGLQYRADFSPHHGEKEGVGQSS